MGTGSRKTVGNTKLVYAAEVSDVVTLEDYGMLPKYQIKQPSDSGPWWKPLGDNIYEKVGGKLIQRKNVSHSYTDKARDLSGKNVLICKTFWYFGDCPEEIPTRFREFIKKGPAHKRMRESPLVKQFLAWLHKKPTGIRSIDHLQPSPTQTCSQGRLAGNRTTLP